jgi:hypothetical protein
VDLFKDNVIDEKKEVEGVWFPIARGVMVKVARAQNPNFRRVLRRKYKAVRASLEQDDDTAHDLSDELMQEVYAQTVLKDMKLEEVNGKLPEVKIDGVPYQNGTFDQTMAAKLLKNELFRNKIKGYAEDQNAFLMFTEDNLGKDSVPQLSGT